MLGILDEKEPSVQSVEQVWSWGNMHLPSKTWKMTVTASISENKYLLGSMPEIIPEISDSSHVQWSVIPVKSAFMFTTMQPR